MPNHLRTETSPYLLQHADNPVDWYPWGKQALDLAREQNKPIILSIGYSACHWCHVMAHESFENPEIATVMNAHFINIKVDREERPDIDQIYQMALYILNHRNGGWPLTMFLTPEQKPFFGGTYFPVEPRYGLPGFHELLSRIAEAYQTRGETIAQQNNELIQLMEETLPAKHSENQSFSPAILSQALKSLEKIYDAEHGGFGQAPKFFHPAELAFCLQFYDATQYPNALQMVTHTLSKMAKGGIFDQLGGGFYRYSTDKYWRIPHFEKMLYDNGTLLQLYANAWLITGSPLFQQITTETADWVLREMESPENTVTNTARSYYSSLDADSENEEGKFYVWDCQQIMNALSAEEYAIFAPHYGLTHKPNFEQKSWHLEVIQPLEQIAGEIGVSVNTARERLNSARNKLLVLREQRIRPGRDEKTLVSWNALMIKGMARAGRIFKQQNWVQSATHAVDFIRAHLWLENRDRNRLMATFKDNRVHLNAYLDDYAFLLDALLELMQTQFRKADLDFAINLADVLLDQFEDQALGGFFFTSHDHEALIHRPKSGQDNAMPSGNGIAAIALQRLGHVLGEPRYLRAAEKTLHLFHPSISKHSYGCASLLTALKEFITPPLIIILRGHASETVQWQTVVQKQFPNALIFNLPPELADLPECLNKALPADQTTNAVTACVCQASHCFPPVSDLQELLHICEVQGRIAIPI